MWTFLPKQGKAANTGCKGALRLKASSQALGAVQAVTPLVLWLNFSLPLVLLMIVRTSDKLSLGAIQTFR